MQSLQKIFNSVTNLLCGLGQKPVRPTEKFQGLVAHRGVHENALATENTREAFQLAVNHGIWGVEFDLRWTRDGVPVIYHDANLGRLHSLPAVQIDFTYFNDLREMAPSILTLQEVVSEFGKLVHFMIELKVKLYSDQQRQKLQDILSPLDAVEDFHFLALDSDILDSVQVFTNQALLDVAIVDMPKTFSETVRRQHGGLTGHFLLLDSSKRKKLDDLGMPYGTGFIETEGCLYRELNGGASWIFTDVPLRLKAFLN